MKHISLGGLDVSRIGLGTMAMSGYYLDPDSSDGESIRTIQRALDLGVTHIDTAEIYRPLRQRGARRPCPEGASRRGRGGHEVRPGLPCRRRPPVARLKPGEHPHRGRGLTEAIGDRPRRPLYQHRVDPNTPIEDTVGTLAELVAEGKVLHIGLSEAGPRDDPTRPGRAPARRIADRVLTVDPRSRGRAAPAAARTGHRPGALLPARARVPRGTIRTPQELSDHDWRKTNPRFTEGNFEKNLIIVDEVKAVACELDVTPAQVALAWLLAQGDDVAPIPGTKRVSRVEENTAADRIELAAERIQRLNNLTPAVGERHDEANMAVIDH